MADSRLRIAPRLIVFTDTTRVQSDLMLARFAALAHAAQPASVLFTVRDYELPLRARCALAVELRALAALSEQSFGVADRADIARAFGAHALHLPESGLLERDARSYLGQGVFLSRACHDPSQEADSEADALLLSPIFEPRKGRRQLGLAALGRARQARSGAPARHALYALGAVDAGNAAACLAAGAAGIAVIGAALAVDPQPLLKSLKISRG